MTLQGGYQGAALIHRICAVITFGYFAAHILYVIYDIVIVRKMDFNPWDRIPWCPGSRTSRIL